MILPYPNSNIISSLGKYTSLKEGLINLLKISINILEYPYYLKPYILYRSYRLIKIYNMISLLALEEI